MLTPTLPTLSMAAASPAAPRQLAATPFCVADKPLVACVSPVPGAAVPWDLLSITNGKNAINIANHYTPSPREEGPCLRVFERDLDKKND